MGWVPDVSENQEAVDMAALRSAGAEGVILRAGFGTVRADRFFEARREAAEKVGLPWMAYWFNYPAYNPPEAEAEMFNGVVGPLPPGRGMSSDFENDDKAKPWPGPPASLDWARRFLAATGPRDYSPIWYSSPSFVSEHGLAPLATTWRWWVAHYDVPAPTTLGLGPWLWQHTSKGTVAGIGGPCDVSVTLRGSFADLLYGAGPRPKEGEDDVGMLSIVEFNGQLHTARVRQNGDLTHDFFTPGKGWASEKVAAGLPAGAPVSAVVFAGQYHLFLVDAQDRQQHWFFDPGAGHFAQDTEA